MSREPARNLAASVRSRLLTLAQEKGEDYQRILGKYAVERFLFRLGARNTGTGLFSKARCYSRCLPI